MISLGSNWMSVNNCHVGDDQVNVPIISCFCASNKFDSFHSILKRRLHMKYDLLDSDEYD